MLWETVTYSREAKLAKIALNRPGKLNAINSKMMEELEQALGEANADQEARVVIIRGNGRSFCSGYDIEPSSEWSRTDLTVSEDRERCRKLVDYWLRLWSYPRPVIGQVHGHCLAGGGELLAICDIVIASEDASFGHPAGRAIGIPPTLSLWPVLIGLRKTKELLFTGDAISAHEACRLGLVNRVVPPDRLEGEVEELAGRICRVPSEVLAIHKHAANRWFEIMGLFKALYDGAELDVLFHQTPSFKEFYRVAREKGFKAALEWRDAPFQK